MFVFRCSWRLLRSSACTWWRIGVPSLSSYRRSRSRGDEPRASLWYSRGSQSITDPVEFQGMKVPRTRTKLANIVSTTLAIIAATKLAIIVRPRGSLCVLLFRHWQGMKVPRTRKKSTWSRRALIGARSLPCLHLRWTQRGSLCRDSTQQFMGHWLSRQVSSRALSGGRVVRGGEADEWRLPQIR